MASADRLQRIHVRTRRLGAYQWRDNSGLGTAHFFLSLWQIYSH